MVVAGADDHRMCSFLEIEGDGRLARGRHGDECVVLTSDEVFFRLMLHCEKGFEGLVFQLEGVLLTAVRQRLAEGLVGGTRLTRRRLRSSASLTS